MNELERLKKENERLQNEIESIRSSATYKIGRLITWAPGKARKALNRLKIVMEKPTEDKMGYEYHRQLPGWKYEAALKNWYRHYMHQELNLNPPITYNEKIQWMKLYDATPLKTTLSDKYLVRDWVKERIGEEYLVPLLGVWDSFDEIDFDKLPDKFVLKANHGSEWNIIVKDKSQLDLKETGEKINWWLRCNFAWYAFEMQYLNIQPRVIAEEYLESNSGELYDYKVFCFNGRAESIMIVKHVGHGYQTAFYDPQWNKLPYTYSFPQFEGNTERPVELERMVELAENLSAGFPHVRVDFYALDDGSIKFGEMTFTPSSGKCEWYPPEQNRIYGDLIELPEKKPIPRKKM